MELPRRELDAYDERLSRLEREAMEHVRQRVSAYTGRFPGATPEEAREFAKQCVSDAVDAYGDASAAEAADMYEALAKASGVEVRPALVDTSDVSRFVDDDVRYRMRRFLEGDFEEFARLCGQLASDQVSRRANQTMRRNCRRDGLKWARVPMGGETCDFCLMLASRGFVYKSASTAGEGNHYHRSCRCKIVPGFKGMKVAGYDPDALYSDYLDGKFGTFARKKRGGGSVTVSHEEAYRRMAEFKERLASARTLEELDSIADEAGEWFKSLRFSGDRSSREQARDTVLSILRSAASRRHGELTAVEGRGIVTYTKPRSELLEHEKVGIDWLSARGYDVETIPEDGSAAVNLDIRMDGAEWEMKNVTNAGSSVENQLARAKKKFWKLGRPGEANIVITSVKASDAIDKIAKSVREKGGYKKAIVISGDSIEIIEK